MAIAADTGRSGAGRDEPAKGFTHAWLAGALLAGTATPAQLAAFATALAGLYDHLPRLFGPPVMTGPDYKVRRFIVDQLLTTVALPGGATARVGEGGHAALAKELGRALGVPDAELDAAALHPRLVAAADTLVATMFEPPAWASMAAVAEVEQASAPGILAVRDALRDRYGLDRASTALFDAPPLYPASVVDGAGDHLGTAYDGALFSYYRHRIREEWLACWDHCFDAAAEA